jgi:hypothetical protein
MSENKNQIENLLEILEKVFPATSEKISTIAFVNWHNILNHSSLEGLNEKEILFCCNTILALASVHFHEKIAEVSEISQKLKEVSFEDTINFLKGDLDKNGDDDLEENNLF